MNLDKTYYVYILASKKNGTLYVGFTSDLARRVYIHRNNLAEGFTKKYNVHMLVYYQGTSCRASALTREKQIKKWNRAWKIRLINDFNPNWEDLSNKFNFF